MIERIVAGILSRLQRVTGKKHDAQWDAGRTFWDTAYLARHHFSPRTLIDVGAAGGSPFYTMHSLYDAYPDAYLVLIEPLVEYEGAIRDILSRRAGTHFSTAVGDEPGSQLISIHSQWIERSAIPKRTWLEDDGHFDSTRTIPVTTLDALQREHRFEPPFGLKIDVEGWEDRVIKGAENVLRDTEFVIAEVSVADRFVDGYSFAEFIALMDERGFSACDFLDIGRAVDSTVTFVDLLFKRTRPIDG